MTHYRPHMRTKVRSRKIRDAAAGRACTIRVSSFVPGHTCSDPSTSVLCHFGGSTKGTGTKVSDLDAGFGCFNCHQIIDGPDKTRRDYLMSKYPSAVENRLRASVSETLAILLDEGILTVSDGEIF